MMGKQQASDDSKSEYALELQKTNQAQREHYEAVMPQIFQVYYLLPYFLPLFSFRFIVLFYMQSMGVEFGFFGLLPFWPTIVIFFEVIVCLSLSVALPLLGSLFLHICTTLHT